MKIEHVCELVEFAMAASGTVRYNMVASGSAGYALRWTLIGVVLVGHAFGAPPFASAQDPGRIGSRILP